MLFSIFFIAILIELYVLMTVGSSIGVGNTVLLVIITAFIGSYLLKQRGLSTLQKVKMVTAQGNNPSFEMLKGVVIMISSILLLMPGFITDSIGLLGLMPWTRALLLTHFLEKNTNQFFTRVQTKKPREKQETIKSDDTIEGEFWEE